MLHVLNARLCPEGLIVIMDKISPVEAKSLYWKHIVRKSHIGYPNACRELSKLVGDEIVLNREETDVRAGDECLIMALRYRVDPSEKKGRIHGQRISDYDFFHMRTFSKDQVQL